MYPYEKRIKAVELFIKYHLSTAPVIRELGYPDRKTLKSWYQDYVSGTLSTSTQDTGKKKPAYTSQQQHAAVEHYITHGKNYLRTIKHIGYPTRDTLRMWVERISPQERKVRHKGIECTQAMKIQSVIDFCMRDGSAQEVAEHLGVTRLSLYQWRHQLLLDKGGSPTVKKTTNDTFEDMSHLLTEIETLKQDIKRLQLERDLLDGAAELIKKDPGISLQELSNKEKTQLIDALRSQHSLETLMQQLKISGSSYYYQKSVLSLKNKYTDIKQQIQVIFDRNHRCYGYRRIHKVLAMQGVVISEKVVRRLMAETGLQVSIKRRRKYSSYQGEITPAPDNLVARNFHAARPNQKWLTDITEFHLPAGKIYLSPIVDCFDGYVVHWSISTSPTADMVNAMLDKAAGTLNHQEQPIVHSDRGGHYRWPGWIAKMEQYGLTRSMSKKACTADNAACEGFFGRIKNEMFYNRSWHGVSSEAFVECLDRYLHWYNEDRIKISLGGLSPVSYRKQLGFVV